MNGIGRAVCLTAILAGSLGHARAEAQASARPWYVPEPGSDWERAADVVLTARADVAPAHLLLVHNEGGEIRIELEHDNGQRGACYTPCRVDADAGGLRIHSGHMTRIVRIPPSTEHVIEVDPGWSEDGYRSWILSFVYGGVGAAAALVTSGLMAANVGAENCRLVGGTTLCDAPTWPLYVAPAALTLLISTLVVQLIALGDPPNGDVRWRPRGGNDWLPVTGASLSPLLGPDGTLVGAGASAALTF